MGSGDITQKHWNDCHVLLADGMHFGDYVEQLTYLLFLKMAGVRRQRLWDRRFNQTRIMAPSR